MSRGAWAVVPAKALSRGKSRLSGVLADDERAAFARKLFEHVLDTALATEGIAGVLVATDAEDVASIARARGAKVRPDGAASSLAEVADGALAELAEAKVPAAIVLMADLPRIVPADVAALLAALADADVALVRDHEGQHTNALALAPPDAMKTCFGDDSFARHLARARDLRLRVAVVENPRVAFDVDAPGDLARLGA